MVEELCLKLFLLVVVLASDYLLELGEVGNSTSNVRFSVDACLGYISLSLRT